MKIIDLLNKIAKGEEVPLVIKCEDVEFALEDNEYYYENCENNDCYALFDYFAFEKGKKSYEVLDLEVEEVKQEIIEEVEDKEYEDIEEITDNELEECECLRDFAYFYQTRVNELIRNQKKIIERLDK
jgi:hypothetical protein